jgi:amidase
LLTAGIGSPLHGIPLLVKDNIATKDAGLHVSAGSFALLGAKPGNESSVIEKLRKAGVVILGKTNLSEWANFRGLDISAGWSPRGGQTLWVCITLVLRPAAAAPALQSPQLLGCALPPLVPR